MPRRRETSEPPPRRRSQPAPTPRGREQQIASKAYDLAEKQIEEGTASSQVMSHFLKMGSTREELEQQRIQHEISLMEAKKQHMEAMERQEALFAEALRAMTDYKGGTTEVEIEIEQ